MLKTRKLFPEISAMPGSISPAFAGKMGTCYQLGVNIIHFAHSEYSKWLESTKE